VSFSAAFRVRYDFTAFMPLQSTGKRQILTTGAPPFQKKEDGRTKRNKKSRWQIQRLLIQDCQ